MYKIILTAVTFCWPRREHQTARGGLDPHIHNVYTGCSEWWASPSGRFAV